MQRYYIKAHNAKSAKSVEVQGIVIESIFEQINWCGVRLTTKEKKAIKQRIDSEYDTEFTIGNVVCRVCFESIRKDEVDRGFN